MSSLSFQSYEWRMLNIIKTNLEIFKHVTAILSGRKYITAGYAYISIQAIIKYFNKKSTSYPNDTHEDEYLISFENIIKENVKKYITVHLEIKRNSVEKDYILLAAFLDPDNLRFLQTNDIDDCRILVKKYHTNTITTYLNTQNIVISEKNKTPMENLFEKFKINAQKIVQTTEQFSSSIETEFENYLCFAQQFLKSNSDLKDNEIFKKFWSEHQQLPILKNLALRVRLIKIKCEFHIYKKIIFFNITLV
jgi:hypothetical protein